MIEALREPHGWNLELYQWLHATHPSVWAVHIGAALAELPLWLIVLVAVWRLRTRYRVAGIALAAVGLCIAVEATIGWLHPFPRPFVAGFGPAWVTHAANNAFPSTHVSIATALALVLGVHGERVAAIACLILAMVMGWARIYVGIHWPADVIGAVLLAAASVLLIEVTHSKLPRHSVMQRSNPPRDLP